MRPSVAADFGFLISDFGLEASALRDSTAGFLASSGDLLASAGFAPSLSAISGVLPWLRSGFSLLTSPTQAARAQPRQRLQPRVALRGSPQSIRRRNQSRYRPPRPAPGARPPPASARAPKTVPRRGSQRRATIGVAFPDARARPRGARRPIGDIRLRCGRPWNLDVRNADRFWRNRNPDHRLRHDDWFPQRQRVHRTRTGRGRRGATVSSSGSIGASSRSARFFDAGGVAGAMATSGHAFFSASAKASAVSNRSAAFSESACANTSFSAAAARPRCR